MREEFDKGLDLIEALNRIDPAGLNYQEWVSVGMALKEAGHPASVWEEWSRSDHRRYHEGECLRKWSSFTGGSGEIVTGGTIVKMAMDAGWRPTQSTEDYALDWDSDINDKASAPLVNRAWLEAKEVTEPRMCDWHPANDLITYLSILFDPSEYVGYVTDTFKGEDGRRSPMKGNYDRTAGQLIDLLRKCGDDVGAVLGDSDPEVGAWIRFNPLDGKGVKNDNVTAFRFALVESDEMTLEEQHAMISELELPVAALVSSGGKSLHAIVRIDAGSFEEYRTRVDFLYSVCEKNGLKLDRQNRNPSRLSRLPGVMRNGRKQFLVATNIGKSSWTEWKEWIESVNDDLPDPESMSDIWGDMPPLAPPLISDVLRKGHKMLIAGPSKAGKSYALIELCCALAEGRQWLGFDCAQGRVMYVNLELDRASCLHRFKDVYNALGWQPNNLSYIDIWNLRGKSVPMDKLAPKLIRRARKKDYTAIIIDPIYKVITGDENSADQMANFCNQFDKVCTELGCAVIYCHHHSKGSQGGKRSMDRASGSGVFARDPDALLDLIELPVSDELRKQEVNNTVCKICVDELRNVGKLDEVSQDDMCSERAMLDACERILGQGYSSLMERVQAARKAAEAYTAWRIEGTLREFPKFPPVNAWFQYPVHKSDTSGVLADVNPEETRPPWEKASKERKKSAEKKADKKLNQFLIEFANLEMDGPVSCQELAEKLGMKNIKTLCSWFGNGKEQREEYKSELEIYTGEDGKRYLRRKEQGYDEP